MITFADIPVLLEDPDGRIAQFVEHFLSFADLNLFGDRPISLSSNRPQSRSGQKAFRGLPLPNYPAPPRFKLNAFYWPTGAARWARAHFSHQRRDSRPIEAVGCRQHAAATRDAR
jgi:hypothetical protein